MLNTLPVLRCDRFPAFIAKHLSEGDGEHKNQVGKPMKHISLLLFSLMVLPCAAQSEKGDSLSLNDSIDISEITVTAQRPLVRQEADRISYDVKHDEDAKTQTIIEMLKKVPFVTVDAENNITVKGSSNFKIYKNGGPTPVRRGWKWRTSPRMPRRCSRAFLPRLSNV